MVDHYRFQTSVSRFETELACLRRLASSYQTDIYVHLMKEGDRFICKKETDEPMPQEQFLLKKPLTFPHMEKLHLDGIEKEGVSFHISREGFITPKGKLTFSARVSKECVVK